MIQLFVHWTTNPVIFNLGFFSVRWYSLLFVCAFIIGWYIIKWIFDRENVDKTLLDPLLYTLLIGTIVGARLGHCLFYQPDYYLSSWDGFLEIFMTWKGGLASHGGTLALIFCVIWFARHYGKKHNFDFFWIADRLTIPLALAASLIRLGNLFNSEIYGDVTTLPWGFIFENRGETLPKHPTQLYEAFSYLLCFALLLFIYKFKLKKIYRGTLLGIFFISCFTFRFLIEFIKEPQVTFEQNMILNMGQLLSLPFILLGMLILGYSFYKKKSSLITSGGIHG